jgi:uncharacterized protein (DUF924 family)
MNARDAEAALLARCVAVAHDRGQEARDQQEANVFDLAAMILRSQFPSEAVGLMRASERYFAARPDERLAASEVIQRGWVSNLPRLRDMLSHRFREG